MESKEFEKLSISEKLRVPVKDLPKQNKISKGCLSFVIVMGVIIVVAIIFGSNKSNSVKSTGIDSTSLYYYSKVMAQSYVKENLKAPSTAKFPDEEIHIGFNPDSSVVVKIGVDAQNSFGAMIRGNYYLKMKWNKDFKDTDNWSLIKIENESE